MYDIDQLEKLCKPLLEYLKTRNPYISVVITSDLIKIEETQINIPQNRKG